MAKTCPHRPQAFKKVKNGVDSKKRRGLWPGNIFPSYNLNQPVPASILHGHRMWGSLLDCWHFGTVSHSCLIGTLSTG